MEKIGLYDVDSKIPNLALMRISAFYKSQGFETELYKSLWHKTYRKIYASKIFNFSSGSRITDDMILGGTGIDLKTKLPEEIKNYAPDYSLYNFPHSIGFAMRGCRFRCKFCHVPKTEGKARANKSISAIWTNRSSRFLILLDNDFFGNPEWKDRIEEIIDLNLLVNFSQGFNIRLITEEQASYLSRVKFRNLNCTKKQVHFAWDRFKDERLIKKGIDICTGAGITPNQMAFYVLIGFDTTPEQDMYRVKYLRNFGCDPYVMPYDKKDLYQRHFARWVNHKAMFKTCSFFEYLKTKELTTLYNDSFAQ